MSEHKGCYTQQELEACSFMSANPVNLNDILDSEISLHDKYWFVCTNLTTREENQQLLLSIANVIVDDYMLLNPNQISISEGLAAAEQYVLEEISLENLAIKRENVLHSNADNTIICIVSRVMDIVSSIYTASTASIIISVSKAVMETEYESYFLNHLKMYCEKAEG